jgi:hypothetical protein
LPQGRGRGQTEGSAGGSETALKPASNAVKAPLATAFTAPVKTNEAGKTAGILSLRVSGRGHPARHMLLESTRIYRLYGTRYEY